MSNANSEQVGGKHYKGLKIEPWDFIVANNIPYLEGNAIKYIARWREKGGIEDINKAIHYLQKIIELEGAAELSEHQRIGAFLKVRPQANPSPKYAYTPPPKDAIYRLGQQAMWGTMQDEDNDVLNPEENGGW